MKSSKLSKHDIVYILRNDIVNISELIYSLRSLVNFPHGRVWFAGGTPDRLKPDRTLPIVQHGGSKWERTTYTIRAICECEDISKSFWLFNDDFFILRNVAELPPIYNGDIQTRIDEINSKRNFWISKYAKQLKITADELTRRGLGTKNYAVHIPMLINKDKALEVLDEFRGFPMFRSLYGNYHQIGGENRPDVKITARGTRPDDNAQFVSTSDESFKYGLVGRYIRRTFTE